MSESKGTFRELSVADGVIIKLPDGHAICNSTNTIFDGRQYRYSSTKEFFDKLVQSIFSNFQPQKLIQDTIKAEILEPGKNWVTGKLRCRLIFEFIPDEPEKSPNSTDAILGSQ